MELNIETQYLLIYKSCIIGITNSKKKAIQAFVEIEINKKIEKEKSNIRLLKELKKRKVILFKVTGKTNTIIKETDIANTYEMYYSTSQNIPIGSLIIKDKKSKEEFITEIKRDPSRIAKIDINKILQEVEGETRWLKGKEAEKEISHYIESSVTIIDNIPTRANTGSFLIIRILQNAQNINQTKKNIGIHEQEFTTLKEDVIRQKLLKQQKQILSNKYKLDKIRNAERDLIQYIQNKPIPYTDSQPSITAKKYNYYQEPKKSIL